MSNKEKNSQKVEPTQKKDYTSVLEKIRKRTGLLVGIVGLALVIFILESLLGSGASIFGGDEISSVGYINGHKIDRNEFAMKLENQMNNYRQRNQGQEVDDNVKSQAIESIWQQYIVQFAVMPQFLKAGLTVGEDELYQKVVVDPDKSIIDNLTDPNTGKLSEQFARADGSLDLAKWKQAVQNVVGEQEQAVRNMEDNVKSSLFFKKFRALVKNGLYVTTAEAKEAFKMETTKRNISFIIKRYSDVSDSAVKVSDDEIEKYYKDHSYKFKALDNTRKVEYVAFNVMPSKEDLELLQKDAARVADEFKGRNMAEDSAFIAQESENGNITIKNYTKKTMVIRDSSVFGAAPGTVYGPYNEGAYLKVYKLEAVNSVADSARVRHILIGTSDPQTNQPKRSKEAAKKEADSILVLLKAHKTDFDSLVRNYSDDQGSKTNGGDYGWFDENEQFVEPFKNAGLYGTKGNISAVETQFGYHIIEVLDVSASKHTSYRVAEIFKLIAPSEETNQHVFGEANQFGGENNTADLFDKAVTSKNLSKRMADNIKESDRQLTGLDGARDLVKWAFTAKKGEVSVFSFPDKHVVAKLAGIRNKGVLPLEEVRAEVLTQVTQEKKSEMLKAEFAAKSAGIQDINQIAGKLGLKVTNQMELVEETRALDDVGQDYTMLGTVAGLKAGSISKPLASANGVFIIAVNSIKNEPALPNYKEVKTRVEQALSSRSDYQSFTAVKELADIEDHKSRID